MVRVYESRTNRALVHNYFIARKYCLLSRYVANGAYQTISDIIQLLATDRVASVTGYKCYIHIRLITRVSVKYDEIFHE